MFCTHYQSLYFSSIHIAALFAIQVDDIFHVFSFIISLQNFMLTPYIVSIIFITLTSPCIEHPGKPPFFLISGRNMDFVCL